MKYITQLDGDSPILETPEDYTRFKEEMFKSQINELFSDAIIVIARFLGYDESKNFNEYMLNVLSDSLDVAEIMKRIKTMCIEEACEK